jgi:hypothetical protein
MLEENSIGDRGCSYLARGEWKKLRILILGSVRLMKEIIKLEIKDVNI